MERLDATTDTGAAFRCPVCRHETFVPWHRRPHNHDLRAAVGDEASPRKDSDDDEVPHNLAAFATRVRRTESAVLLEEELLPALEEAAGEGRSYVVIKGDLARRTNAVADLVAPRLFERGIFAVDISPGETIVHIVDTGVTRWKSDLVNPSYGAQLREAGLEQPTDIPATATLVSSRRLLMRHLEE